MNLDLKRIWEIMNKLSYEESKLSEEGVFISLLGNTSNYSEMSFEGFLNYYSFKVDGEDIVIYNEDSVQWEDYQNNDFSSFPLFLLSFSPEKLENWMKIEIELQLAKQEREKIAEKENIKRQIELLTKKLNNHA